MSARPRSWAESANAIPVLPVAFPGFLLWLSRQARRSDVIGIFARNVARIERVRRGRFTALVPLLCFCQAMTDPGMALALDLALAEWRREVLSGRAAEREHHNGSCDRPAPLRIGPGIPLPMPPHDTAARRSSTKRGQAYFGHASGRTLTPTP